MSLWTRVWNLSQVFKSGSAACVTWRHSGLLPGWPVCRAAVPECPKTDRKLNTPHRQTSFRSTLSPAHPFFNRAITR